MGDTCLCKSTRGSDERNLLFFKELKDPMAPQIDAPFQTIIDQFEAEVRVDRLGWQQAVRRDRSECSEI